MVDGVNRWLHYGKLRFCTHGGTHTSTIAFFKTFDTDVYVNNFFSYQFDLTNLKLKTLFKSAFMEYDQKNSGSDFKGSSQGNIVFDLVFG